MLVNVNDSYLPICFSYAVTPAHNTESYSSQMQHMQANGSQKTHETASKLSIYVQFPYTTWQMSPLNVFIHLNKYFSAFACRPWVYRLFWRLSPICLLDVHEFLVRLLHLLPVCVCLTSRQPSHAYLYVFFHLFEGPNGRSGVLCPFLRL